jgi:hypothetical protein
LNIAADARRSEGFPRSPAPDSPAVILFLGWLRRPGIIALGAIRDNDDTRNRDTLF